MENKYVITITETLQKTYIVTGKDHNEAMDKIKNAYENGDIVLDYDDYLDCELYSKGVATENQTKIYPEWED